MRRKGLTVLDCIAVIAMTIILLMLFIPSIVGAVHNITRDDGLNKTEAIIETSNGESITVVVDKWYTVNDDSQIKIITENGEVYYASTDKVTIVMSHDNEEG